MKLTALFFMLFTTSVTLAQSDTQSVPERYLPFQSEWRVVSMEDSKAKNSEPPEVFVAVTGLKFVLSGAGVTESLPKGLEFRPPSSFDEKPMDGEIRISLDRNELQSKATKAFSAGRYQEAFETATKICQLKPDNMRNQLFLGDVSFAAGKIDKCVAAFDAAIRIQPEIEPQLWQRGLALYYANRFAAGAKQFETHQTVNSQDVENAVWHLLCSARISDVEQARKKLIPITDDARVPMYQIYEMFADRMTPADVMKAAGNNSVNAPRGSYGHRLQLYYAHLYIGLYHEMLGKNKAAMESLKKAAEQNPLGKINFMGQVARVHLKQRASKK